LLDILEKRGIKVTFFVIGQNVAAHPEIVRRELADGDEIGNPFLDSSAAFQALGSTSDRGNY
jgi:hypothetical protein